MSQLIQHLINGIAAGTIYALVALGYTMVYGVLKLINFAHGDVMMVGVYMGYATALMLGRQARGSVGGVLLIFLVAMVGCALLGFLIERFAYRPLREKPRLTALITAIGISFTLSYGFQLDIGFLPGSAPRAFPQIIKPAQWFTLGDPEFPDVVLWNWQVISLLVAVALMAGLQFLVYRTRFGRAMRAVSFDHRVAALMGIPTDRIISVTFMIGSALAAGAGLLYAIKDTSVSPLMGLYVGLKAFVAAVIGGIGNVPGAMVGGLLLGLVEEFVVGYAASTWRDAVAFGFLILVLLVRPGGLFGRVAAEKV
ncbi:branched-chain amino acid ABC transporter permease [Cystobacter fuscus]|uniref:Branched-chain amino acid ABC transporter permease n=1 Tax=Cystobacter fuscus TaxID=43 RepID=A0A250JJW2_9BACT|nr:branched-chain amino acid ABC transporter permease [Cystobacter fuscus]ATB43762.1 branched-chain amino acid ABC transporter permease [Cystobacter fuscus]AYM53290.1 branched-chain amino acid ABC transporter permease [Cystobacter fuscus]